MKNVQELSAVEAGNCNGGINFIDGIIIVDPITVFPSLFQSFPR